MMPAGRNNTMNITLLRIFMSLNTLAIRLSRGRIGGRLGTQTILLLHSTGRKSGKEHVIPIAYFQTDGFYFIIGSNWGKEQNAGWYHNLKAQPRTVIEVGGQTIRVEAREAVGDEYDRLWRYAVEHHPPYQHYKEMTARHIPILVLKPV
jgi:deazaflavin-dependent oxidoreductase (nitroreductase family)